MPQTLTPTPQTTTATLIACHYMEAVKTAVETANRWNTLEHYGQPVAPLLDNIATTLADFRAAAPNLEAGIEILTTLITYHNPNHTDPEGAALTIISTSSPLAAIIATHPTETAAAHYLRHSPTYTIAGLLCDISSTLDTDEYALPTDFADYVTEITTETAKAIARNANSTNAHDIAVAGRLLDDIADAAEEVARAVENYRTTLENLDAEGAFLLRSAVECLREMTKINNTEEEEEI